MTTKEIFSQTEHHMKRSIETLKDSFMKIRTGRAHTGLLEHITVDYYGSPTPISQVAQLGLADARTITVQPWEKKMVAVVEKAIRNSDLGLNPATSGDVIRVPMPPLTEERRRDLTKVVANTKVAALLKEKEITEDDERRSNTEIQKLTDKYIGEIDKLSAEKEKEIMTV